MQKKYKQLEYLHFFEKENRSKVPEENLDLEWKDLPDLKPISIKKGGGCIFILGILIFWHCLISVVIEKQNFLKMRNRF